MTPRLSPQGFLISLAATFLSMSGLETLIRLLF